MEHFCQLELTAQDRQADRLRRAAEARLIRQAKQAKARERMKPVAAVAPAGRLQVLRPALARFQAGLHVLRLGRLAPHRAPSGSRRYDTKGAAAALATIRLRPL